MHPLMKARFAYAQARIQARYALLINPASWRHLTASRTLSAFLEEARTTPLEHWLAGLSLHSDPHHIEQALRLHLHHLIMESAQWMPNPWRPAVTWTAWAVELPLLNLLIKRHAMPDWAWHSPLLGTLPGATDKPLARLEDRLAQSSAAPLLRQLDKNGLQANWMKHWRTLWPPLSSTHNTNLEHLLTLLGDLQAQTDAGLSHRLQRLFRRVPLQPAALFTWLALLILEYRMLRGALIQRAIFSSPGVA